MQYVLTCNLLFNYTDLSSTAVYLNKWDNKGLELHIFDMYVYTMLLLSKIDNT